MDLIDIQRFAVERINADPVLSAAGCRAVVEDKGDAFAEVDAAVEIAKEGVALHYEGGTVRPDAGGKALAIPLDASVYGKKPSEWSGFRRGDEPGDDDVLSVFWPKNSAHGFLKERDTGNLLYLLVPSVTIRADRSVLPEDGELLDAAQEGIMEAVA